MNYNPKLRYLRLHRSKTDSYMTYALSEHLKWDDVELWIEAKLPGWELIHASAENSDVA